jgi:hypothetical protein
MNFNQKLLLWQRSIDDCQWLCQCCSGNSTGIATGTQEPPFVFHHSMTDNAPVCCQSLKQGSCAIPAQAEIHTGALDFHLRGNDDTKIKV